MMKTELSRPLHVEHIDRNGRKETVTATPEECEALARRFDLLSLDSLEAEIEVRPVSGGTKFEVTGRLTASVTQESVVSGKAVEKSVSQDIVAWYADTARIASFEQAKQKRERDDIEIEHEIKSEEEDPETIVNGIIDLGEVTAQFLGLALDEFPRAQDEEYGTGDYIEVKPEDAKDNPFAKLAQLKEKK